MDRLQTSNACEADDDFCHPLFICSWEATNDGVRQISRQGSLSWYLGRWLQVRGHDSSSSCYSNTYSNTIIISMRSTIYQPFKIPTIYQPVTNHLPIIYHLPFTNGGDDHLPTIGVRGNVSKLFEVDLLWAFLVEHPVFQGGPAVFCWQLTLLFDSGGSMNYFCGFIVLYV